MVNYMSEVSRKKSGSGAEPEGEKAGGRICESAENQPSGRVWLVGAGPGAPDLLTKRGYDLLQKADVVVYDALILPETLEMIPPGTRRIYVGKRAGAHSVPQEEIQKILIREAGEGKRVVRLKGGDPFVFGRGGEEALALAECGIPCEIVPGVTSAVAVPEAFGIPVTHRGLAASFTVITGHGQEAYRIDYGALVRTGGTLIFLMGLSAAEEICRGLMEAGMQAAVPAAALSKGTTPGQRMVLSNVGSLEKEIRAAGLEAPVILAVGEVCALAPLLGKTNIDRRDAAMGGEPLKQRTSAKGSVTVVVTRQEEKAQAFSGQLRAMGMNTYLLPAIRIRKPEEPLRQEALCALKKLCAEKRGDTGSESRPYPNVEQNEQKPCEWIVFTSANGVLAFFDLLPEAGLDMRSLFHGTEKRFAVVGQKTAQALRGFGIQADLVSEEHTGAALGEALGRRIAEEIRGNLSVCSESGGEPENCSVCPENGEKPENRSVCPENGGKPPVWFFGARQTDGGLEKALLSCGVSVNTVPVYETVSAVDPAEAEKLADKIQNKEERLLFTFTSASCVRNLTAVLNLCGQTAVCIGEKTAKAAEEAGMRTVTAEQSTEESMLEAVRRAADELCQRDREYGAKER